MYYHEAESITLPAKDRKEQDRILLDLERQDPLKERVGKKIRNKKNRNTNRDARKNKGRDKSRDVPSVSRDVKVQPSRTKGGGSIYQHNLARANARQVDLSEDNTTGAFTKGNELLRPGAPRGPGAAGSGGEEGRLDGHTSRNKEESRRAATPQK